MARLPLPPCVRCSTSPSVTRQRRRQRRCLFRAYQLTIIPRDYVCVVWLLFMHLVYLSYLWRQRRCLPRPRFLLFLIISVVISICFMLLVLKRLFACPGRGRVRTFPAGHSPVFLLRLVIILLESHTTCAGGRTNLVTNYGCHD